VAAIRWGTTARQHVVTGTLATIAERLRAESLRPPATIVIGNVVSHRRRIEWTARRPLFGLRVLVPAPYPGPLTHPLEDLGAEVLHVAPVELQPPPSWVLLDRALDELPGWAGVVLADGAAVTAVRTRLAARGRDARALAGLRVIAASRDAAHGLGALGIVADAVVEETSGDWPGDASAAPWLVAGRADAQEVVAAILARHGIRAVTPPAGTMAPSKSQAERLREVLTTRPAHAVVLADPGEARGLLAALDAEERSALAPLALIAVGAATGAALAREGLEATMVAEGSPETVAGALGAAVRRRCDDAGA